MRIGVSLPIREMQNDLGAIKGFAQAAEDLGLTHLRVPEQVIRPKNGHLHEAMTILAYIAGVTSRLGVAFNSTFIALVISIVLMFLMHQLQLIQERLVLDTNHYCDQKLLRHLQVR